MTWRIITGDCVQRMRELPDASIDACVCDPPYALGFMGREWDRFGDTGRGARARTERADEVTPNGQGHTTSAGPYLAAGVDSLRSAGPTYQHWCEAWAREALRVLKPGGHLLAFGGTRTSHRLAAGIEDAGFEIRDTIAWMYGSGFPKSLDVAKAVDKMDAAAERDERAKRSQAWLRQHVTPKQVNKATSTDMGHHLTTHPTQPFVPTPAMLDQLRLLLPPVPEWLEQLVRDRAVESQNMAAREVVGERNGSTMPGFAKIANGEPTSWSETPHTPEAQAWEGWGTALKPAHEPIVVARKPLASTVAANVLAHGTGALNIDGCRIEGDVPSVPQPTFGVRADGVTDFGAGEGRNGEMSSAAGRWPANVVLDEEAARLLDEQTGELPPTMKPQLLRRGATSGTSIGGNEAYDTAAPHEAMAGYGDSGGASRFFYVAKASTAERNAGLDGFVEREQPAAWGDLGPVEGNPRKVATGHVQRTRNVHPTVKPIELMRWLVRLVTPPGGTVLDPFLGSGTTGCAAVLEGVEFVGIEREAEYVPIADARIRWWAEHPDGMQLVQRLEAESVRRERKDAGQLDMLDLLT
jgi:DNA modification methylase